MSTLMEFSFSQHAKFETWPKPSFPFGVWLTLWGWCLENLSTKQVMPRLGHCCHEHQSLAQWQNRWCIHARCTVLSNCCKKSDHITWQANSSVGRLFCMVACWHCQCCWWQMLSSKKSKQKLLWFLNVLLLLSLWLCSCQWTISLPAVGDKQIQSTTDQQIRSLQQSKQHWSVNCICSEHRCRLCNEGILSVEKQKHSITLLFLPFSFLLEPAKKGNCWVHLHSSSCENSLFPRLFSFPFGTQQQKNDIAEGELNQAQKSTKSAGHRKAKTRKLHLAMHVVPFLPVG